VNALAEIYKAACGRGTSVALINVTASSDLRRRMRADGRLPPMLTSQRAPSRMRRATRPRQVYSKLYLNGQSYAPTAARAAAAPVRPRAQVPAPLAPAPLAPTPLAPAPLASAPAAQHTAVAEQRLAA
ncbi:MAG: hypothetical protein AAGC55_24380, partial [Myxococcota bacterium]